MKIIKKLALALASLVTLSSMAIAGEAKLDGYCPVCYIAANKAVKGVKEFQSEHNGNTYWFVKAAAKEAFDKSPEKFLPQYDGLCAYGVSLGKEFKSDPTQFAVVDGKLYLNSSKKTQKLFKAAESKTVASADTHWKTMKMKKEEMMKKEMMEKEEKMKKEKASKY